MASGCLFDYVYVSCYCNWKNRLKLPESSLAVQLSVGHQLPLAAIMLGNLYSWLDRALEDCYRSMGRYVIGNFAPLLILIPFLYERFPHYAPAPVDYPILREGEKGPLRFLRWNGTATTLHLGNFIDVEDEFGFMPYRHGVFFDNCFFGSQHQRYLHVDNMSDRTFNTEIVGSAQS